MGPPDNWVCGAAAPLYDSGLRSCTLTSDLSESTRAGRSADRSPAISIIAGISVGTDEPQFISIMLHIFFS